jgi:hypothetical protein
MRRTSRATFLVAAACAGALTVSPACARRETGLTSAERLAKGKQIVQRMSDALASAPAFTLTSRETREEIQGDGKVVPLALSREITVRRPDHMYFKTSGDRSMEGWYDGAGVTVVAHKDKVFAQARMPETLDRTIDALHERYGIYVPGADMLYSKPAHALLTDTTTGGWVGVESVEGESCDHLAFEDRGVNWELWVPNQGTPVPRRSKAEFPHQKRLRKFDITFTDWNLTPVIAANRFTPVVPGDYEGIAMIQRAAVLANIPEQPVPISDQKK